MPNNFAPKFRVKGARKSDVLYVRLNTDSHEKVKELAKQNNITMLEVVRQMIDFAVANMGDSHAGALDE